VCFLSFWSAGIRTAAISGFGGKQQLKIELSPHMKSKLLKLTVVIQDAFLFFAIDNVRCINDLANVDPFLIIVDNLKLASSNMLDLCTKHLGRILNYAPCPSFVRMMFFFAEQTLLR
jgi:hypothetical protein